MERCELSRHLNDDDNDANGANQECCFRLDGSDLWMFDSKWICLFPIRSWMYIKYGSTEGAFRERDASYPLDLF